jgi:hypothetical protein
MPPCAIVDIYDNLAFVLYVIWAFEPNAKEISEHTITVHVLDKSHLATWVVAEGLSFREATHLYLSTSPAKTERAFLTMIEGVLLLQE